jgi:hypothetical protein
VLVAVNFGAADATATNVRGTVRIGTDRSRDGQAVDGTLTLGPNEGAVVQL